MSTVVDNLRQHGLALPPYQPLPAGAPRIRTLIVADLLYVSGHGPDTVGAPALRGYVGGDLELAAGVQAARQTALNILATVEHDVGLDRVARVVKLLGMVRSAPGFIRQPEVVDGASEVFIAAFGEEAGIHTRSAVGLAELPMGIPVEIEAQFLLISGGR